MTPRAVFVSYSQSDRDRALAVVARLEQDGMPCWVAPRDVEPGADWAAEIVDAIAGACVMVLVFSASANCSAQVCREVERAVYRGIVILPFRVEDVMPARSLEYFLSTQHWLDAFPPPMEPHYARLSSYVKSLLANAGRRPGVSTGTASEPPSEPQRTGPAVGMSPALSAATLQRLESELARYVGPVARHLVRRAAPRASSLEGLITELAAEIESEAERRRFISATHAALPTG
jgi:hypothetical protein